MRRSFSACFLREPYITALVVINTSLLTKRTACGTYIQFAVVDFHDCGQVVQESLEHEAQPHPPRDALRDTHTRYYLMQKGNQIQETLLYTRIASAHMPASAGGF